MSKKTTKSRRHADSTHGQTYPVPVTDVPAPRLRKTLDQMDSTLMEIAEIADLISLVEQGGDDQGVVVM
ncbi:MAG: hypothetical protein ACRDGS_17180, partial [Chloroflexota bacterium]